VLRLREPKVEQYGNYMKGIFVGRDLGSAWAAIARRPASASPNQQRTVTETFLRV